MAIGKTSKICKKVYKNGLVANPKKTALVFLNLKQKGDPITIGGETITQTESAKLLGITFDDDIFLMFFQSPL